MSRGVLRVVRYRFRATFGRRWGGFLALVLLIALTGGIAMASVGAARRTQSSFSAYLKSTNPSDITISAFGLGQREQATTTEAKAFDDQVAHLPHVRRVATLIGLNALMLTPQGTPNPGANNVITAGSVDGLYLDQDRVTVIRGRAADPARMDEFVASRGAAQQLGLHLGQTITTEFATNAQLSSGLGPAQTPTLRLGVRLVGIVESVNDVLQDDVDRVPGLVVFTPAVTRRMLDGSSVAAFNLQLDRGGRDAAAVEQSFLKVLPVGSTYNFHVTSRLHGVVERAVRPESIALGGFGLIAGLAALFIGAQAIARQVRAGDADGRVLRALGAGPSTTVADGLAGALGAILLGALLAAAVAVVLSPIAPLGPVRAVYPASGIAADWTVLGLGLLVLIVALGAVAAGVAFRTAPHRAARRSATAPERGPNAARVAAASGLPEPAVVGIRFALDRGGGPAGAPVRSALMGTALAVAMMVATLTFGASLHALVSRPALYGWNWSYLL